MKKTILITGASSGFGRGAAELLAAKGHKVFGGIRDIATRNGTIAGELRAKGIEPVEIDVALDSSVEAGVAKILAGSNGGLDVVVNNAGIASAGVSEAFTAAQLRDLFEVNVFGVQRVLRATLPSATETRAMG